MESQAVIICDRIFRFDPGEPLTGTPLGYKRRRRNRRPKFSIDEQQQWVNRYKQPPPPPAPLPPFGGSQPTPSWSKKRKISTKLDPAVIFPLLFERDGYTCHWCGRECATVGGPQAPMVATMDHWIRLARGGADHLGNLVVACRGCNSGRHCQAYYDQARPETRKKLILCQQAEDMGARGWTDCGFNHTVDFAGRSAFNASVLATEPVCELVTHSADCPALVYRTEPAHERLG